MNTIFILEDSKERIDTFKKYLEKDYNLAIYDNVEKAIEYLSSTEDDIVTLLLDHDLDGKVYVPSHEKNTGYQLAKYIEDTGKKYPQIIIHSMNPVGVDIMSKLLRYSTTYLDCIPFPILAEKLAKLHKE